MKVEGVAVKEGYTLLAYIIVGDTQHAIVNRNNDCQPYTVCKHYDPVTGSWGHGVYFTHYEDAVQCFGEYIAS